MGNTHYSIATVLTAFMGGLALGSFLGGKIIDRAFNPLAAYAILEGGIGYWALADSGGAAPFARRDPRRWLVPLCRTARAVFTVDLAAGAAGGEGRVEVRSRNACCSSRGLHARRLLQSCHRFVVPGIELSCLRVGLFIPRNSLAGPETRTEPQDAAWVLVAVL